MLDISGVLYVGDAALPGAVKAMHRLRSSNLPIRFLTNSTRTPKRLLIEKLRGLGVTVTDEELFTPAQSACDWLAATGHSPHLLVHPDLEEDFASCAKQGPKAVILGDAGPHFNYAVLNAAFRRLAVGAPFLALAANRVFLDADGELSLDAGAFVAALEYASGKKAKLLGKPAPAFFSAAASSMGCELKDVTMVGDDAEADVAGALAAGAGQAILVRTGKYRERDESRVEPTPSAVVDGIVEAVEIILR